MVSYEGSMKVADRSAAELPFVLMEMNLDEVQWLKVTQYLIHEECHS